MDYNEKAAKWWAEKLRNVGPTSFDNGDTSEGSFYASMLATMLAMDTHPSDESVDKFEARLAEVIREKVEKTGYLTLSVDYHPDFILATVASETNVNESGFPWKTTMWVYPTEVSVRAGYGAPVEVIFPEEKIIS